MNSGAFFLLLFIVVLHSAGTLAGYIALLDDSTFPFYSLPS